MLTVRVLQASGLPSKDLVTSSDCYVTLNLPTASSGTLQTRTVKNSRNPVWNQTFHFRIHRQLKNVMELKVFDQDLMTKDDPVLSVLFDVGTLQVGTQRQSFSLSAQEDGRLEVEFRLQTLTDCEEQLISNGILVGQSAKFNLWLLRPARVHRKPLWAPGLSASIIRPAGSKSSVFICRMTPMSS